MTTSEQLFQEFRAYKQLNQPEQEEFWKQNAINAQKRTSQEKENLQEAITDNLLKTKELLLDIKLKLDKKTEVKTT